MKQIGLSLLILLQLRLAGSAQLKHTLDTVVDHAALSYIVGHPQIALSAGIVSNGQSYLYHYGAATDQTLYEIGSSSKTFASLILAHAVLEKRVQLSDDIRKYLDGDYPNLQYEGHAIELLHLVNLTSRLPNNMPDAPDAFKNLGDDSMPFAFVQSHQHYTRAMLLDDLHRVQLDTLPGVSPRHSNSAAKLLVYILENVYQKPFPDLVKQYILTPLQMNHTYFTLPVSEQKYFVGGRYLSTKLMPPIPEYDVVAIGMKSTIGDMTRYIRFQLEETDSAVRMTHQALWGDGGTFALGMNWFLDETPDGKRKVNNDGTTFGFTTYILLYPALRFGVVLLINSYDQHSNDKLGETAENIFETAYYTLAERASDGFGFSPSINKLLKELMRKGFDQAIAVASDQKASDATFTLTENEVNAWAYFLLGKGKKEEALAICQLNVHLYPASANTYDSLGEIYALLGNKDLAIKNYERSLELNPGNTNAVEQLKKLGK